MIDRFCAGLSVALLLVASSALGQDSGLTTSELAALERGDLVTRETRETREGRLWIGGVSYLRVYRPREQVWRAIHDLGHWREMLPSATEARAEDAGDHESLVEIHHAYGPIEAQYTLRVSFDERAHRCSFALALERRHDIRAGHGFVEVHRWPDDPSSSILVWAVLADPGDGLLTPFVLDPITQESVRVPWRIRAFLDGPGVDLYRE